MNASRVMAKPTIDLDAILKRATPVTNQHAHEIQPFGHLVRMPIALSEQACKESVENLNQLLADTCTLRDLYKNIIGRLRAIRSTSCIFCSTSTTPSRTSSSTRSRSAFSCWAVSASPWRMTSPNGRSFRGRQRGARRCRCRYRGSSMRTKSC